MQVLKEIPGAPAPVGPYSAAVKSGNQLFCSGQIGLDPESGEMKEGVEAQLNQVISNLKAVLKHGGSSIDKIIMSTIFLTDISDGALVNKIYQEFVSSENPPARQTVAVKALPVGALVEISLIAEL